jgi:hypothetical protein
VGGRDPGVPRANLRLQTDVEPARSHGQRSRPQHCRSLGRWFESAPGSHTSLQWVAEKTARGRPFFWSGGIREKMNSGVGSGILIQPVPGVLLPFKTSSSRIQPVPGVLLPFKTSSSRVRFQT